MNSNISVVIPTFNGARFIREALESVFAQTLLPAEIIVVDDASTDGTADIVSSMVPESPVRLRVISMERNTGGPVAPLNRGVYQASTELIGFLDQDDLMEPRKLELLGGLLEVHPEAGLGFGQHIRTDANNQPIIEADRFFTLPDTPIKLEPNAEIERLFRHNFNYGGAGGIMIRKAAWRDLGGFRPEFRIVWDYDFVIRSLVKGYSHVFAPEPVFRHRLHDANLEFSDSGRMFYRERARLIARWATNPAIEKHLVDLVLPELRRTVLPAAYWERANGNYSEAMRLYCVALRKTGRIRASLAGLMKTAIAAVIRDRRPSEFYSLRNHEEKST